MKPGSLENLMSLMALLSDAQVRSVREMTKDPLLARACNALLGRRREERESERRRKAGKTLPAVQLGFGFE